MRRGFTAWTGLNLSARNEGAVSIKPGQTVWIVEEDQVVYENDVLNPEFTGIKPGDTVLLKFEEELQFCHVGTDGVIKDQIGRPVQ